MIKIGHELKHDTPEGFVRIYCGRVKDKNGIPSKYGNPFSTKNYKTPFRVPNKGMAIKKFKSYIQTDLNPNYRKLKEFYKQGNVDLFLTCFCKKVIDNGVSCHCDVIKEYLEG